MVTRLQLFQNFIRNWFVRHGRLELPWRRTSDPYAILVSELMLQQTQVSRVIPKYQAFIQRFPNLRTLRQTQLSEVLLLWQGLGYNRRARYLWQLSQQVQTLPTTENELKQLPGIGEYTAAAICAFAYNQPVTLIETNVRSVFLYHFFHEQSEVPDKVILPLISASLDRSNPRQWYWALMDYGSHLKQVLPNPNRRSRAYAKQSTFNGSLRQTRGQILKILLSIDTINITALQEKLPKHQDRIGPAIANLVRDEMIEELENEYYRIKSV